MSDQVVDAASIGGRHRLHLRELVLVHTGLGLDACRGQPVAERFVPAFGGFQRDMALEEQIAELLDLFRLVLFGKRQRLGEQPARSGLVGLEQLIGLVRTQAGPGQDGILFAGRLKLLHLFGQHRQRAGDGGGFLATQLEDLLHLFTLFLDVLFLVLDLDQFLVVRIEQLRQGGRRLGGIDAQDRVPARGLPCLALRGQLLDAFQLGRGPGGWFTTVIGGQPFPVGDQVEPGADQGEQLTGRGCQGVGGRVGAKQLVALLLQQIQGVEDRGGLAAQLGTLLTAQGFRDAVRDLFAGNFAQAETLLEFDGRCVQTEVVQPGLCQCLQVGRRFLFQIVLGRQQVLLAHSLFLKYANAARQELLHDGKLLRGPVQIRRRLLIGSGHFRLG